MATLTEREERYGQDIRNKDSALRAFLAGSTLPPDIDERAWLAHLTGIKAILGNLSNDARRDSASQAAWRRCRAFRHRRFRRGREAARRPRRGYRRRHRRWPPDHRRAENNDALSAGLWRAAAHNDHQGLGPAGGVARPSPLHVRHRSRHLRDLVQARLDGAGARRRDRRPCDGTVNNLSARRRALRSRMVMRVQHPQERVGISAVEHIVAAKMC